MNGEFLHYIKGLKLKGQLAYIFFNEVHVTFIDILYREQLRELWTLRYLECPFTRLITILIMDLKDVLKERLCIDNV
jgi:hypothetical protein